MKKTLTKEDPIFKFDPETGKSVPLPRRWMSTTVNSGEDTFSEKKMKRMTVIAPLKLTAADFEESPSRASKLRKTDNNSVRKELFNLPTKATKISRPPIYSRQYSTRRSIISTKKVQPKVFNPGELSPLLDMEEVEEELLNKKGCLQGYPFKTPSKPVIKFTKATPSTQKVKLAKENSPKMECPVTPGSVSSTESEFLEIEKMCYDNESDKENCNQSPISSVCNLLESAAINSTRKHKKGVLNNINMLDIISNIENLLQENRIDLEQYRTNHEENNARIKEILESDSSNYKNLLVQQNKNNKKITEILSSLKDLSTTKTDDKEDSNNRRSIRLLNKSPMQNKDAKLIVPSAILRGGDLRKSTLTKNLVTKSQQYEMESPRNRKALDMYNSIRNEITILATPKSDRKVLYESPKSTNLSRTLSRRIQKQCLLLQDTPVHK